MSSATILLGTFIGLKCYRLILEMIKSLLTFIATISGVVIFVHIKGEAVLFMRCTNINITSDIPYPINIQTSFVAIYLT